MKPSQDLLFFSTCAVLCWTRILSECKHFCTFVNSVKKCYFNLDLKLKQIRSGSKYSGTANKNPTINQNHFFFGRPMSIVCIGIKYGETGQSTLKRLTEKVLSDFSTPSTKQCFDSCKAQPACVGQNVLKHADGTLRCQLITLSNVLLPAQQPYFQDLVSGLDGCHRSTLINVAIRYLFVYTTMTLLLCRRQAIPQTTRKGVRSTVCARLIVFQ